MMSGEDSSQKDSTRGISPVVGTILMLAIVVVLAGAALFFLTGLDSPEPATAGVSVTDNPNGSTDVRLVSVGSAEKVYVVNGNTRTQIKVGENVTVYGEAMVIGESGGEEQLLQTVQSPDWAYSTPNPTAPTAGDCTTSLYPSGDGSQSNPYVVVDDWGLQCMNQNLDAHYVLGQDISAAGTSNWNSNKGFEPVGSLGNEFTGSLDGNGHEVAGLTIDRNQDRVGLFGHTKDADVSNLRATSMDIDSNGNSRVGLIGVAESGTVIDNVSTSGEVSGGAQAGGIVGLLTGSTSTYTGIKNSDSSVTVTATGRYVGGAVGRASTLVNVSKTYATGDVSSTDNYVGGLIGQTDHGANVSNSYATGDVDGSSEIGGLIGEAKSGTLVETSYATGTVSNVADSGGITGETSAVDKIHESYWDETSTTQSSCTGTDCNATGLTTPEMTGDAAETNMSAFDFVNVWETVDGEYPKLRD